MSTCTNCPEKMRELCYEFYGEEGSPNCDNESNLVKKNAICRIVDLIECLHDGDNLSNDKWFQENLVEIRKIIN